MEYIEFEQFESLKMYKENLSELAKTDFTKLTNEEIYNKYYDLALILPTTNSTISSVNFNSLEFHRVRLNVNFKKEDKNLEQTYSNPPTIFCSENGRANLKGTSVFYCSNDPKTAMEETRPNVGDTGVISVWKGKSIRGAKFAHCLNELLPQQNIYNLLAKQSFQFLSDTSNITDNGKSYLRELILFIAEIFTEEQQPYPLSSMISNELLFSQDLWHDAIVYPSFTQNKLSCNLAFHPNSVNELLELKKIMPFKIIDEKNGQLIFNFNKKIGERKNNTFLWREISIEDKKWFNENQKS
nr:RES domain-containing protein [Nonlabens ulvanivorans]